MDYPRHSNVGDSAIWLGQLALIKQAGGEPVYVCDIKSYRESLYLRLPAQTVTVFHGGGSFGDYWPEHHAFRLGVMAADPRRDIIQMPQSISFAKASSAEATRQVFDRHIGNVLLGVRDRASLERAENLCGGSVLAPDSATYLHLRRSEPPTRAVGVLARTDHERNGVDLQASARSAGVEVFDWVGANERLHLRVGTRISDLFPGRQYRAAIRIRDARASANVRRGVGMLSRQEVLVTDRLHGQILATLAGVTNVAVDSGTGKLSEYYETWLAGDEIANLMPSPTEALDWALHRDQRQPHG